MTKPVADKSCYAGTRVLVLGAAGFVGRWVARALVGCGAEVCLVVLERAAAEPVFQQYGIRGAVLELDLTRPGAVRRSVQEARPSITFNLAGYGVNRSERDEQAFHLINVALVEHLCGALAGWRNPDWPGAALVHAGSIAEYGPIGGDLSEDSEPKPVTAYGRYKLGGTRAMLQCAGANALPAIAARLGAVYGPGKEAIHPPARVHT